MKILNPNPIIRSPQSTGPQRIVPLYARGDILNIKTVDIKARGRFPFNLLSNFAETNFTLDGVRIRSMEGFLQALKINDPVKQREMCLLGGFEAKKMSKAIKRPESDLLLFWNGEKFLKGSDKYNRLKEAILQASKSSENGKFEFDGKEVASIQSFFTAIKVESPELQDLILKMPKEKLALISKEISPRYQIRNLYWDGKVIKRDSEEYQQLLDRAYNARYAADFKFREALKASEGYTLTHRRGKNDILETVLTQDEFIQRLNSLRDGESCKYRLLDSLLLPYHKLLELLK